MAMADGYAQASRSLGVVNLHISCGLGNAMGMLYNAYRAGTPLLVTAGQQDRRLMFEEPILWSDMVRVAEPWMKWAAEVASRGGPAHGDPPRRADGAHAADRSGVSLAADGSAKRNRRAGPDARPSRSTCACARPSGALRQRGRSARRGAQSGDPGRQPHDRGGRRRPSWSPWPSGIGAPVMSESGTTHGRLGFPADHPLSAPGMPIWSPEVRARLADHDVILVVGHGPVAAVRLLRAGPRDSRTYQASCTSIRTRGRSARTIRSKSG